MAEQNPEALTLIDLTAFIEIDEGTIFRRGYTKNHPTGYYVSSMPELIGKLMKFVAVKGWNDDWSIYVGWNEMTFEDIKRSGDKVISSTAINLLVPCTEEVFSRYRY